MDLDDLILLYHSVQRDEVMATQDRYRLENRLNLMIEFYKAKETMHHSKYAFENNAKGTSVIKLD